MSKEHNDNRKQMERILAKRGVHPTGPFNDYSEYIEQKEKTLKPELIGKGLVSEGSMHLALGRIMPTRKLKI